MRKVLALVLALAMVLGCFASVFAAEYTDVKADADYATAVSVLSDLGVVSGYTDGTYKPEKVVSRAEMAALLVKALGLTPAASATTNFSDVPATHWASGYVAYANTLGIIAGYTDGTFKPEKTVSYDEAITMIISALGYKAEALEGTTWPTAYILKAQQLKITKGVDLLGSVGANRGDIAELLYNTLGQTIGKTNKDGEFKPTTGDTMFVRLGATGTKTIPCVTGDEKSAIDLDEYLGAEIEVVLDKEATDPNAKILAVTAVNTEYLEGKATATKIGDTKLASGTTYGATKLFVNGVDVTGSVTMDETYKFAVKYNDDDEVDTIVSAQIWDGTDKQAEEADVKAIKDGKTTVFGVAFPATKDGKAIDESKIELVGVSALSEIKELDVVTTYVADGVVVKVEVSNTTVTGKVTKFVESTKKATINGTAYDAPTTWTSANADFKNEYVVYFNYAGDQFGVIALPADTTPEVEWEYGVVLATAYTAPTTGDWSDSKATDAVLQVKLVDATGAEKIFTVNKKATDAGTYLERVKLTDPVNLNFKAAPAKGTFVQYKLNADNELIAMEDVADQQTWASGTPGVNVVVKSGLINKKAMASDVIVFMADDTDMAKAKFTVANTLKDDGYEEITYVLNDKQQVALVYVGPAAGAGDDTTFMGIYTSFAQTGTDTYEMYFMEDGVEKTVAATTAYSGSFTGKLVTVKLVDDAFDSIVAEVANKAEVEVTTKAAINGTTYVSDKVGEETVVLADTVIYYAISSGKVTVSDQETFLKAKGTMTFYDTDKTTDYVYDVVVFNK